MDSGTIQNVSTNNNESTSDQNFSLILNETKSSAEETHQSLYEAFIILEIIMTFLELALSVTAAIKITRWRRNYRNQLLMQLSLVRLIKRLTFLFKYLQWNSNVTSSIQIYCDFVLVILICVFIKHMYDTLIVVMVKNRQGSLYKILAFTWVFPVPVSVVLTSIIAFEVLSDWTVYLIICIIRWPVMLLGTLLYLTILYRVLKDKIRHFARALTVVTFLLCLVIHLYLFCRDAIFLWCIKCFLTDLISYILGLILNLLVLTLYLVLVFFNLKQKNISNKDEARVDTNISEN